MLVPNFSVGAVLMMKLAAEAAKVMPHVEIIELHHEAKKDAPSGTAKLTARRIAEAGGPATTCRFTASVCPDSSRTRKCSSAATARR